MTGPPRLSLWIIERTTPTRDRDEVVGDVIEDFHAMAVDDRRAARRWVRRQARRSLAPGLRRRLGPAESPQPRKGRITMHSFLADVRFGLRLVRRQPLMATAGVLSLAVGLGLNVLLFTLANAVLFKPMPLRGAERFVLLQQLRETSTAMDFSYPAFEAFGDASAGVFDSLTAFSWTMAAARAPQGPTESVEGEYVSGNLMPDLAVPIAMGRGLSPDDDRPDAPPVVVVSHGYWQQRFNGAPLAGQTLTLNEQPFTVVGVAAPAFLGMDHGRASHYWVPIGQMQTLDGRDLRTRATTSWLSLLGRLAPGVTHEEAIARLTPFAKNFYEELGYAPQGFGLAEASQGSGNLRERLEDPLRLMMAASLFVLLIACVNVANLQLARTAARRTEIAVRAALGASRARLAGLMAADALILTVPAGIVALLFAVATRGPASALIARFGEPVDLHLPIDVRVAGAALAMTVVAALIVGGLSALLSARRPPALHLAEAGRSAVGGANRTQRALVVLQFALSMTLVAGAALLVRTVDALRGSDIGFSRDVAFVDVALDGAGYTRESSMRYFDQAIERIEALPGVEAAAVALVMPLDFGGSRMTISVPGYVPAPGEDMELNNNRVSAGYFELMDIPVLAGRTFDARDVAGQPDRVVINRTLAERFFPGGQAVGRHIAFGSRGEAAVEVIGVVADTRYRTMREAPRPTFYRAMEQSPVPFGAIHVRTTGDPAQRLGEIQRAVASVDPRVPVRRARTLPDQLDRNIADERMARSIAASLGLAALVLAATGLYATMAFAVRRRTREIGVRMALGAQASDVSVMVVRQGLGLVAIGAAAGLAGAVAAGRALESQLYGVSSSDATSFVMAAALLTGAALVATWLPARRATAVDPVVALRD